MSKNQIIIIAALILAPVAGMLTHTWLNSERKNQSDGNGSSATGETPRTVSWPDLAKYDLEKGAAPGPLLELDGRMVRLPGFMVPLEDNMKLVKEFLLVPDPQACIHYPPPPPNQQVLVQMVGDASASVEWKPVWVEGNLRIAKGTTKYGTAIFQIKARRTEAYKAEF